jgi:trimethylamine--corrinoid protein Co-methyltransferase
MRILSQTGIRLFDEQAVKLFAEAGARVDGNLVRPSEKLILDSVAKAPASFALRAKNPEHDMSLGAGKHYYAAAYGCPSVLNPDGSFRPTTLQDHLRLAKLVQTSEHFRLNGGILAQPNELGPAIAGLCLVYATMLTSDKCLFLVPDGLAYPTMQALAVAYFGGQSSFEEAPKTVTLISALSPLQMDAVALRSLRLAAEKGQAVIITPGPMAGASGPITLAGNMALANAECLVGVALAQLVKPGAPVLYGVTATTTDLRDGSVSIGCPEFALQASLTKSLADFYRLPCRGGGAVTDACFVDAQSGLESMMALFVSVQSQIDLIIHSAGAMASFAAVSYEKMGLDLEMISRVEHFQKGVEVNDDALALPLIDQTGPGGLFLNQRHTLQNARKIPWRGQASPWGREKKTGSLLQRSRALAEKLIADYSPPPIDEEALKTMDEIMRRAGVDKKILEGIKKDAGL